MILFDLKILLPEREEKSITKFLVFDLPISSVISSCLRVTSKGSFSSNGEKLIGIW
jgi:hypothetical protein